MSYWGTTKPIIFYGTSYATSWDLESDSVNCVYIPRWEKERIIQESDLDGYIDVIDKSSDETKGRMYLEISFQNPIT